MEKKFIMPFGAYYLLLLLGLSKNEQAINIIEELTNTVRSEKCFLRKGIYSYFNQECLFLVIDKAIRNNGINSLKTLELSLKEKIYFIFLEFLLGIYVFIKIEFQFSIISVLEIIKERFNLFRTLVCRRSNVDRRVSSVKDRLTYGIYLSINSYKNNQELNKISINKFSEKQLIKSLSLEISKYIFFQKSNLKRVNYKSVLELSISKTYGLFQSNRTIILVDELIDSFIEQIFEEFNVEMLDRRNQLNLYTRKFDFSR